MGLRPHNLHHPRHLFGHAGVALLLCGRRSDAGLPPTARHLTGLTRQTDLGGGRGDAGLPPTAPLLTGASSDAAKIRDWSLPSQLYLSIVEVTYVCIYDLCSESAAPAHMRTCAHRRCVYHLD